MHREVSHIQRVESSYSNLGFSISWLIVFRLMVRIDSWVRWLFNGNSAVGRRADIQRDARPGRCDGQRPSLGMVMERTSQTLRQAGPFHRATTCLTEARRAKNTCMVPSEADSTSVDGRPLLSDRPACMKPSEDLLSRDRIIHALHRQLVLVLRDCVSQVWSKLLHLQLDVDLA